MQQNFFHDSSLAFNNIFSNNKLLRVYLQKLSLKTAEDLRVIVVFLLMLFISYRCFFVNLSYLLLQGKEALIYLASEL